MYQFLGDYRQCTAVSDISRGRGGAGIADLSAGAQLGLGITAIGCLTPHQIGLRSRVSIGNNSTTKGENNHDLHRCTWSLNVDFNF